jgi:hypothetical protein
VAEPAKTSKSQDNQSEDKAAAAAKSGGTGKTAAPKVRIELKVPPIPGSGAAKAKDTQSKSWPKTVDEMKAEQEAKSKPPAEWSPQEVADSKARCAAILKRIHAVSVPKEPIKEGLCGTPAPIELISIGQNPQISLSPPAIVNCDFAEALQTWIDEDVQPLAKRHLGNKVIKMEVMSSYSCRNAYGRKGNKLSEHGLANALDIRGFVTSIGKTAYVLEHWGTTQREIAARIAAEKAKAAKELAAQQQAEKAAQAAQAAGNKKPSGTPPSATTSSQGAPAAGIARNTIADGLPRITVTIPGGSSGEASESFSLSPSHLGGPKGDSNTAQGKGARDGAGAKSKSAPSPAAVAEKAPSSGATEAFLHALHAASCRRFGTTLGPEANAAHRNHFHIDMAVRKTATKICD